MPPSRSSSRTDLQYDPKTKVGTDEVAMERARLPRAAATCLSFFAVLSLHATLHVFVLDSGSTSSTTSGNLATTPQRIRAAAASRSLLRTPSLSVPSPPYNDAELDVVNAPKMLPWKKAEKVPRSTPIKVLPVDFGYYFNPSILELDNGRHIFALRMGWLYGGNCQQHSLLDDPVEATFFCLKLHKERFVDQTLLGEYDPESQSLVVVDQGPSILAIASADAHHAPEALDERFDTTLWDSGAFWHDTRLIFPYNRRPTPGKDKILVSAQSIEILGCDDCKAIGCDASVVLHLTSLAAIDPGALLDPQALQDRGPSKMTRWLFYDADLERQEWEKRRRSHEHGDTSNDEDTWKLTTFDVARLKCKDRPQGLPSLPFQHSDDEVSASFRATLDGTQHAGSIQDSWSFVKDKNWAPFVHDNKVLWSYSLFPNHVVCENDIDLAAAAPQGDTDVHDVDCVLCVTQHNSSSSHVMARFYRRLQDEGYEDVVAHLNGAPAYLIEDKGSYLGLMHVIKTNRSEDELGWEHRTRTYEHYFYMTESKPPFRLKAVSSVRAALSRSRGWSHWFDISDEVMVEFAMYLQYHPDRVGREIVVSYGEGDRIARAVTLSLEEIWSGFADVASSDASTTTAS